jgi:hypothetical protein
VAEQRYVLETDPMQPLVEPPPPLVPTWCRRAGLMSAAYVAGLHLGLSDDTYKQARYLGAAFVAGALVLIVGASIAAAGRRFGPLAATVAWACDSVVMLAALVAVILSRTTGLPSYHHNDWPPTQLIALVAEAAYLGLSAVALTRLQRHW